ncbi:hypothetical protein DERF_014844 [Dermatophagoides farinae]|uniref:Uncharacterized protein n=1 Tax=Dermatophagoides farinae TaxID=6954 RepID=A0A922HJV5_DERFA|nr:hypothetical protein DERF_014844 [Dermatophagoides farinae]
MYPNKIIYDHHHQPHFCLKLNKLADNLNDAVKSIFGAIRMNNGTAYAGKHFPHQPYDLDRQ